LNGYAARHFALRHLQWLHAAWSAGATAGPALMTGVLAAGASYRVGYAVLAGVLGTMALAFAITRGAWDGGRASPSGDREGAPAPGTGSVTARDALGRGLVWLQVAVFFAYTGLESATGQWCFTLLRDGRGLPVESAGAWTAGFWGSLLAGRVLLGFLIERVGPDRLLRLATVTTLAGAGALAASDGLAGRIGLLVLGASLAPMYPTLMARTPDRLGYAVAPHAVGFQVTAATLGAAAVPSALGGIAARLGVEAIAPAIVAAAVGFAVLHEALLGVTRHGRR
jgi:fucose permease